jgi:1-acyl-sn-glycerol-3-phosphate acyltransferase
MKSLISFITLLTLKGLSNIFYKYKIGWPKADPVRWDDLKLIVLLNHTSLLEVLYIGIMPVSFLRRLSRRLVVPIASKTIARPVVGFLFKIFSPGTVPITRKRDKSWNNFLDSIYDDSIILIIPEGRMKRRTGLDVEGNKMNVKPGVVDILANLKEGQLAFAYSGGLHHVQAPGEGWPKLFKTLYIDLEAFDIPAYKAKFDGEIGSYEWKRQMLDDMQNRLETKPPVVEN